MFSLTCLFQGVSRLVRFRGFMPLLTVLAIAASGTPAAQSQAAVQYEGIFTAVSSSISSPSIVAMDGSGNIYVSALGTVIYKIPAGGGSATTVLTGLTAAKGIAADASGDLFVIDNQTLEEFPLSNGSYGTPIIIASTSSSPALSGPVAVAVDTSGANVYLADTGNQAVYKYTSSDGTFGPVSVVDSSSTFLSSATAIAVDSSENVYLSETSTNSIHKYALNGSTYTLYSVASIPGSFGLTVDAKGFLYAGDNVNSELHILALNNGSYSDIKDIKQSSYISSVFGVAVDASGNIYVADRDHNQVTEIKPFSVNFGSSSVGTATDSLTLHFSVASGTTVGVIQASMQGATGKDFAIVSGGTCAAQSYTLDTDCTVQVSFTPSAPGQRQGAVQFLDNSTPTRNVLQTVYLYGTGTGSLAAFPPGTISTLAGDGTGNYSGDNGLATSAELNTPFGVAMDGAGNLYISDTNNNRIRRVDASSKQITTIAGDGTAAYNGDGIAAASAELNVPRGIAVDGAGNLYIVDQVSQRIRRIDAVTGMITTVAGNGAPGYNGDGIAATSAELMWPSGVAVDGAGNLLIADNGNNRVRRVDAATGLISTVAGDGNGAYSGDGAAATSAELQNPYGVAVDASGNLFIADQLNNRVRRVDAITGIITTVAGNGAGAYSGDGGLATSAEINTPMSVVLDTAGNLYIADNANNRIRRVDAVSHFISTVAGNDTAGYTGDGGPATAAELNQPSSVTLDASGNLYFADSISSTIRKIAYATPSTLTFGSTALGSTSAAQTVTVVNAGNAPLIFSQAPTVTTNYLLDGATTCTTSASVASDSTCNLAIDFAPTSNVATGTATLTSNATPATQTIPLSGYIPAANFLLSLPSTATAGVPVSGTITVTDSNGAPATAAVAFSMTGSDTFQYLITPVSTSQYTVSVTVNKAEPQSIYLYLSSSNTLVATSTINGLPGPMSNLSATLSPTTAAVGQPVTLSVTALDAYGNAVSSYTDTVSFSSSDTHAVLPGNYAFTASDNGTHTFQVPFQTSGSQTVTVTDQSNSVSATSNSVAVNTPSFVVNTAADSTDGTAGCTSSPETTCSLRDALAAASAANAGNITFDPSINWADASNTITVTGTPLTLQKYTTITGPISGTGPNTRTLVTVSGGGSRKIFVVPTGMDGVEIDNLKIIDGSSSSIGNSALVNAGTLTLRHVQFTGNHITGGYGGAIYNVGSLAIYNSTFENNTSSTYGGAIGSGQAISPATSLSIYDSTFDGNTAGNSGGAIYNNSANSIIVSSTFNNNSAPSGGGAVYQDQGGGTLTVANSTIYGNHSDSAGTGAGGGGIVAEGVIAITNSILYGNTAAQYTGGSAYGQDFWSARSYVPPANNYLGGNAKGDPQLAALDYYGGPTKTMLPTLSSPVICYADPAQLPSGVVKDQRGYAATNNTYANYTGSTACNDAGAVQTNYTEVAFHTLVSGYVGRPGAPITYPDVPEVIVTENGEPRGGNPITVSLAGYPDAAATLSGTTAATTVEGGGATFTGLAVNSSATGSGTLNTPSYTVGGTVLHDVTNILIRSQVSLSPGVGAPFVAQNGVGFTSPAVVTAQGGSGSYEFSVTPCGCNGDSWLIPAIETTQVDFGGAPSLAAPATSTVLVTVTDLVDPGNTASATYTIQVTGNTPTVTLSASNTAAQPAYGYSPVTLTASVNATGGAPTSGTVSFYIDGYKLPNDVTVTPGASGAPSTAAMPAIEYAGTHTYTAVFNGGSGNFASAPSNPVPLTVGAPNLVVNTANDDSASPSTTTCTPQSSTTATTDAACTLPDALQAASNFGGGNITFASSLVGSATSSSPLNLPYASPLVISPYPIGNGLPQSLLPVTSIQGPVNANGIPLVHLQAAGTAGNSFLFSVNTITLSLTGLDLSGGNCTPTNCSSGLQGSVLTNFNTLNISNSVIHGNQGVSPVVNFNLAVYIPDYPAVPTLTVTNSSFHDNTSTSAAGAIANVGGSLIVTGSSFTHSSASGGGAILSEWAGVDSDGNVRFNPTTTISESLFENNRACQGGAIWNEGTLTLVNNTIVNNTELTSATACGSNNPIGAGIVNIDPATAAVSSGALPNTPIATTLYNNIIANNLTDGSIGPIIADDVDGDDGTGWLTLGTGNILGAINQNTNSAGTPSPDSGAWAAANLAAVTLKGIQPQALLPQPGSTAICSGDPAHLLGATDQRGLPNKNTIYPGFSSATPCVDAGAVQTYYSAPVFTQQPGQVVQAATNFPVSVTLKENGQPFAGAPISLTVTGTGSLTSGASATTGTNGVAAYTLQAAANTKGTLTATLVLNSSLSPALSLTGNSRSFSTTSGNVYGYLDTAKDQTSGSQTVMTGDSIHISGWAADLGAGTPASLVTVYVDGQQFASVAPSVARSDVASVMGSQYLNTGWLYIGSAASLPVGAHTVTAVATGTSGTQQLVGSLVIHVESSTALPFGYLDEAQDLTTRATTISPGDSLHISGWAADPSVLAPAPLVTVYLDNGTNPATVLGTAVPSVSRPDVATARGAEYKYSGWILNLSPSDIATKLGAGSHKVYAVATGANGLTQRLTVELAFTITATTPSVRPNTPARVPHVEVRKVPVPSNPEQRNPGSAIR